MKYQAALIFFALLLVFGVGAFIYKEMFPEYKTYQYAYRELEAFRSTLTKEKPAPFQVGIKQIMLPDKNNGPEVIDRCTSCHLGMDLPHFSPTRLALDVNERPLIDGAGNPILEANPDYVFTQLRAEIQKRETEGKRADKLQALLFAERALVMHPYIGAEQRPFESHPMDTYGCTSCHSGNGRALVVDRAHGPLLDGEYEVWDPKLKKPQFLEVDPNNDPLFARMYNAKPSHELVFQTTPLLVGPLIEAKCAQCHQTTKSQVETTLARITDVEMGKKAELEVLKKGIEDDQRALHALKVLHERVTTLGRDETLAWLNRELGNPTHTPEQIDAYEGQYAFVKGHEEVEFALFQQATQLLGSETAAHHFFAGEEFAVGGLIGEKQKALAEIEPVVALIDRTKEPLFVAGQNREVVTHMRSHLDRLMASYQRGKELFISQACYACHRIAGYSRAAVGPELTTSGLNYPWFIKESIVWPQADLPSSTMPNFHLDHEEIADLMAFLMAQTGDRKVVSEVDEQISLAQWEMGAKMPWEKPIPPTQIKDVRAGMITYATEGCAACHKLEGFESKYRVQDHAWFQRLFPEGIAGSRIAQAVTSEREAIDSLIKRTGADTLLEEIERLDPGLIPGFYANFQFARRALHDATDQKRLYKVLMAYIQEYGLGRDIAPPLNWSGVYRDQAWLLGHFKNPPGYTAKSIMPVMPFDETKFYMLDEMLFSLGKHNQERFQKMWKAEGFKPAEAYQMLCASCHGSQRQGNGLVAEWIYPIPKNLRDPVFLGNLTKERAVESIKHGVMGTPMPPWGEGVAGQEPVLSEPQITQLVDWLYQGLPQSVRYQDGGEEEKWSYAPQDVVDEMEREGDLLQPTPAPIDVAGYFDVTPNPHPGIEREFYYIKPRYYTEENLEVARAYYDINCAVCHGKDGTGTGERSTTMIEAKPRMFTNLPWIRTRDDLRLLRSIKYGVQGTAMTPWGDQTTSALRMQLVMYIREMTRAILLRDDLEKQVYATFDQQIIQLNLDRIPNYERLQRLQKTFEHEILSGAPVSVSLKEEEQLDARFLRKIALVKEMKTLYMNLGTQLISKELPEPVVQSYIAYIKARKGAPEEVITYLDQKITTLQQQLDQVGINIDDPLADAPAQAIIKEQRGYINLKTTLLNQLEHAKKLEEDYDGIRV